ncbi:MAG: M48 family metallopeptidase [Candidatus Neomarinimicrobiota bacterium]
MATVHPLLDREKQQQARRYEQEKRILGLTDSLISLALLLAVYFSGFSHRLAHLAPEQPVVAAFLIYIVVLIIIFTLAELPLGYFSGYVRERHWGFSNQTPGAWLVDQVKALGLSLVLAPLLLGLLFWIMAVAPIWWWLYTGLATALVGVVFTTIFPVLILPIFNKYTPIDDDELTGRLERILLQAGLKSSGFFMEDLSRRTKKENAFLAGLGRTRRVVLSDNLLRNMSMAEIEVVIAHEVGHYRYRHIWKNLFVGTLQQLIVFFLLDWLMRTLFSAFPGPTRWNLTLFPVFVLLMGAISGFLFGPLGNALSRHFERQADRSALELVPDRRSFLAAMAGLANRNLSNAYPARWIKWLYYSHPPIGERLAAGEAYQASSNPDVKINHISTKLS